MKKLLLYFMIFGAINLNAQTTIFEDSFETYFDFTINDFGSWNGIDVDLLPTYLGGLPDGAAAWENAGDAQAFMIFNPTAAGVTNATSGTEVRNFDPRTGLRYAACWAGVPAPPVTANNDWLISPPVTLGSTGNVMSFWAKSMSSSYGLERYRVAIFVGTDNPTPAQFIFLAGSPTALTAPYPDWQERVISSTQLNPYNGQTVRFGIQCVSPDAYMFMVDDFKVTTTGLSVNESLAKKFSTYPNPANSLVNISNNDNIVFTNVAINDINGRTVKTMKVNNLSEVQLDVNELSAGVYFMNITTDSGIAVKKFIKN
ncbi:T9SS type A sorting domain-containing protein [Flavobacterium sp.]|jgi:hypothetical protein|uniref:T9SS type A sorting domain-containing protein n=1 Tax=Flavobacterium sp. TaxID=239 RepID=UPI0037C06E67